MTKIYYYYTIYKYNRFVSIYRNYITGTALNLGQSFPINSESILGHVFSWSYSPLSILWISCMINKLHQSSCHGYYIIVLWLLLLLWLLSLPVKCMNKMLILTLILSYLCVLLARVYVTLDCEYKCTVTVHIVLFWQVPCIRLPAFEIGPFLHFLTMMYCRITCVVWDRLIDK